MSAQNRRVIQRDPYLQPDGTEMEFRLTYQGILLSSRDTPEGKKARAPHKHVIRRRIHRQLKRLWDVHPVMAQVRETKGLDGRDYLDWAGDNWKVGDFRCVPLVTERSGLFCKLEVLMLRFGPPGEALGDIDNRLKTLFDALKRPGEKNAFGGAVPQEGEDPFFVLLDDDRLITHVTVETDTLLQPITGDKNDTRLVLTVTVRPLRPSLWNELFRD
jgi:hypothetical protein